ncbi:hypothetical protein [Streptomyces coerulescens]|uniref:Uncharacterized protein n=1 Tax=Streptomyces coerulescens TaxID=29304 RepID=A0ABW0CG97_STRCD
MSQTHTTNILTRKNKVGLGLAMALGLFDMTNFLSIPAEKSDVPGPPTAILLADGVLGVITVLAVIHAWRRADRTASRVVAGTRILSAIAALPALFVTGVPAWVVAVVALFVLVSVVVIALVLARPAPDVTTA